ncbi:hypothetical protein, unlikely [Trypanosoma brucei gambiense DAL972]|uniref:Uncharacterized protein n=1 Tax=Trypanosoma brucei gambiense (strain MHOM/CI/86/DAL972) TaxID=679716 RepID=D0AA82_TRYB9|nr:hypothetical protein, unlikely [Trypanosoma brucei gambiense DAL972]CBH18583.1 hypothetical protein, unlikely [Trypanosoma brucei gambiense DAL972]|eukprot:XP_011780847.1 hypothetical protein, unlikely [Trypanosoma brucei gambiense DAL972]
MRQTNKRTNKKEIIRHYPHLFFSFPFENFFVYVVVILCSVMKCIYFSPYYLPLLVFFPFVQNPALLYPFFSFFLFFFKKNVISFGFFLSLSEYFFRTFFHFMNFTRKQKIKSVH